MWNFLLNTYNSGAIDIPTNDFGGSSVNIEISDNSRFCQTLAIITICILIPILIIITKKIITKWKENKNNNNRDNK